MYLRFPDEDDEDNEKEKHDDSQGLSDPNHYNNNVDTNNQYSQNANPNNANSNDHHMNSTGGMPPSKVDDPDETEQTQDLEPKSYTVDMWESIMQEDTQYTRSLARLLLPCKKCVFAHKRTFSNRTAF